MALLELSIRNFAIIKHIELELDSGLTVVTGETGAGKSIVLDALNLLLGARADNDQIRHQEDQCEITALFYLSNQTSVKQWLRERDFCSSTNNEEQNYCLIRRIIRRNKPTKCYINDQPTTLSSLKELGLKLVDIHGQHEHQSLLRLSDQRRIIDEFAEHNHSLKAMAGLAAKINRLQKELDNAEQNHHDAQDRMDLMSFQLNELAEANIAENESEELELEHARLSNAQGLLLSIDSASDALAQNEDNNISSDLGRVIHELAEAAEVEPNIAEAQNLLNSALAQIEDASATISHSRAQIEQNPERLTEVEQRRDTLINLARKHRCAEADLHTRYQQLQAEFDALRNLHDRPEQLEKEILELKQQYHRLASVVSAKRQSVASKLSAAITEQMQDLGMKGGKIDIQVEAKIDDDVVISENGVDRIEFMVSTNYGMPLKALSKTASGGELSRISLAIQVITSAKSDTPTLVFDEVDVGVGGKIAQIVGARLKDLGRHAQVICITHQPQVASQGDQHLFVDKVADDQQTFSSLVSLKGKLRTAEIARMLGGQDITERTLAHAQEMIDACDQTVSG